MNNYQVIYRGIFHDGQGYAVAARGYALALDKIGVDVVLQPMNFGTQPIRQPKEVFQKIVDLANKPINPDKKKILIHHIQPGGLENDLGKFDHIINLVVYEADQIHKEWVPLLNKIDQVWVPSQHNHDIFKNSGVEIPINVFPHGAEYKPSDNRVDFGELNDKFKFLSVFTWSYRKNVPCLLRAFWEEFSEEDNVCLIMKANAFVGITSEQILDLTKQLKKEIVGIKKTAKLLVLGNNHLDDKKMSDLYNTCDCYVLPTRSEGVGLPYMEAMACGKPCIATGWGGQTDFINNENGYLISYFLKPVDLKDQDAGVHFRDYMKLAEANIDHLKLLMRHCYKNKEEVETKGQKSLETINNYTWEKSANMMKAELDRLVSQ